VWEIRVKYCRAGVSGGSFVVGRFSETTDRDHAEIEYFPDRTIILLQNSDSWPVTNEDREGLCWAVDDQTVSSAASVGAVAGVVYEVVDGGVWVELAAGNRASGGDVPATRKIGTKVPLTGGGDLSVDRALAIAPGQDRQLLGSNAGAVAWVDPPAPGVPVERVVATAGPLTGGGDLSVDRALAIAPGGAGQFLGTAEGARVAWQSLPAAVPVERKVEGVGVLIGGGDLSVDRKITVGAGPTGYVLGTDGIGAKWVPPPMGLPHTLRTKAPLAGGGLFDQDLEISLPAGTKGQVLATDAAGQVGWVSPAPPVAINPVLPLCGGGTLDKDVGLYISPGGKAGLVLSTTGRGETVGWANPAVPAERKIDTYGVLDGGGSLADDRRLYIMSGKPGQVLGTNDSHLVEWRDGLALRTIENPEWTLEVKATSVHTYTPRVSFPWRQKWLDRVRAEAGLYVSSPFEMLPGQCATVTWEYLIIGTYNVDPKSVSGKYRASIEFGTICKAQEIKVLDTYGWVPPGPAIKLVEVYKDRAVMAIAMDLKELGMACDVLCEVTIMRWKEGLA